MIKRKNMETLVKKSMIARFFDEAEFNRFGINSAILIIVGCLGGTAVGLGAVANTLALIFVVFPTMATLSSILGLAPMKVIIWIGIIATLIDSFLITYFAFQ